MTGNYMKRTGPDLCEDHFVDHHNCRLVDGYGCNCRGRLKGTHCKVEVALHG